MAFRIVLSYGNFNDLIIGLLILQRPAMKVFKRIRFITILLGVPFILAFVKSDITAVRINELSDRLKEWVDTLHPQKIYLHLDKRTYFSHENIWFKAYLLNGTNLKPDTMSQHVYVELVNPFQQIIQTIRIKLKDGEGDGFFFLKDTVPEGPYEIRAYTNWMKNFGSEYFFNTTISIYNSYDKYLITRKDAKKNRKRVFERHKKELQFFTKFFPEGGQMLLGYDSKIAFKSSNIFGAGIESEGVIKDKDKNEIVRFKTMHNGMGYFILKPEKDKTYTAYITYQNGKVEKVALPPAATNTIGMRLTQDQESFYLNIFSNKMPSSDRPANEIIILGQTREKVYYASSVNLLDGEQLVKVPKSVFPSGIVQFTLINNRLLPIAERLAFVNHNNIIRLSIDGTRSQDSIHLDIDAPDMENGRVGLSAAVLYGLDQKTLTSANIVSQLLLTSDLPGYIQDPNYYFLNNTDSIRKNLDLLMLTNGWKRFLWQDVVGKNYPALSYNFEHGVTVSGKITREIFEFPYRNANVSLFIENTYNDEFHTVSGRRGNFMFENLNYPDTINVRIVVRKPGGGKNLLITLDQNEPEKLEDYSGKYFLTTHSEMDIKAYRKRQNELARLAMDKREKELDSIFSQSIHGRPDNVLWGKDIPPGYSNLLSAMQGRIPGVNISGNRIIIRGINTIYGSTDPLVLVDDIPTDVSVLSTIPPQDVDRVEILKGASSSMYGSRGGNGVIAVYTKHGYYINHGVLTFSMLGYQRKKNFSPLPQDNLNELIKNKDLPVTIYWAPDLVVTGQKDAHIMFPYKEDTDKLVVIVEGTDYNGTPAYSLITLK